MAESTTIGWQGMRVAGLEMVLGETFIALGSIDLHTDGSLRSQFAAIMLRGEGNFD